MFYEASYSREVYRRGKDKTLVFSLEKTTFGNCFTRPLSLPPCSLHPDSSRTEGGQIFSVGSTLKHKKNSHNFLKSSCPHCFWWISLYVTNDAIAKLFVTKSLVKKMENLENLVT